MWCFGTAIPCRSTPGPKRSGWTERCSMTCTTPSGGGCPISSLASRVRGCEVKWPIAALLALLPVPAMAQTIAITGGRVATGNGGQPIEGATVLIRNGRIVSVGRGAAPGGARVIDAVGKWVTPGIFGGFSRLGLVEVDAVAQTNDAAATGSPFGAAISVAPAVNPHAAAVQESGRGACRARVWPLG